MAVKHYGIFDLANFEVRLQYRVASLCNQAISLKLSTDITGILKMCM